LDRPVLSHCGTEEGEENQGGRLVGECPVRISLADFPKTRSGGPFVRTGGREKGLEGGKVRKSLRLAEKGADRVATVVGGRVGQRQLV